MKKNNLNNVERILLSLKENTEVNPDAHFRKNAKIRLMNRINGDFSAQKPSFFERIRVWKIASGFALATVLITTGTVFAAQSSMPQESLYPVKLASEEIVLDLPLESSLKTKVALIVADRRKQEKTEMEKRGNMEESKKAAKRYEEMLKHLQNEKDVNQQEINERLREYREDEDNSGKGNNEQLQSPDQDNGNEIEEESSSNSGSSGSLDSESGKSEEGSTDNSNSDNSGSDNSGSSD